MHLKFNQMTRDVQSLVDCWTDRFSGEALKVTLLQHVRVQEEVLGDLPDELLRSIRSCLIPCLAQEEAFYKMLHPLKVITGKSISPLPDWVLHHCIWILTQAAG